ncbi:MAG: cytochrome P450 [Chloroflexi bacterium]|nr:cytochrome P450 [Chloroflexota bacterium]
MTHAIPLVKGLPFLGNTLSLTSDAIGFMTRAYHEYGPVYRVRVPGREITILAGLDANHLLINLGSDYLQLNPIYGKLAEETSSDIYLPTLDEPQYSYYRRMIKPRLSRDTLADYLPQAIELIRATTANWQPEQAVRVQEVMTRLCIEIISRSAENTEVGDELASIIFFTNRLIGSGVAFQPAFLLKLPDYQRAKRRFEAFLQRIVDQHAAQPGANDDYVDLLLKSTALDGQPLRGHDLLAYVHLPFVNGVAYAPRLSGYLLYELLRSPELLAKVRAEVDAVFAEGDFTLNALRKMRWLYGACMEVLRMYPVAGALPRYIAKAFEFGGHTIEAGQLVFIATGVTHFLPDVYRDPYKFDPERFFEPRSEHQRSGVFAPYGLGSRTCLSAGMGEALIMLVMATLVHSVELALPTPDYQLKTQIAPIPGPHKDFTVKVIGQRERIAV